MRIAPWLALLLAGCGRHDVEMRGLPLQLDQEEKLADQPLSASTQSVNRYRSVLSRFSSIDLVLDKKRLRLSARFLPGGGVRYENVDARFLAPLLPYAHGRALTPFDRLNLMLSEYSRNGVELSLQDDNSEYGFAASSGVFTDDEEYRFEDGKVVPNPTARPKRMSLVNNCLFPGLWEVNANDSVGEMYHAWLTLPARGYFDLVRAVDDIDSSDDELRDVLDYHKTLPEVAIDFDRLRERGRDFGTYPLVSDGSRPIGGYSTQDSRRKVQRKFYRIERAGKTIDAQRFSDLLPGDVFQFHSFIPPGIYSQKTPHSVTYEPIWKSVTLTEVKPRTRFSTPSPHPYAAGALEMTLRSSDGKRALVVGNLPIDLLVFQEDYDIPGFGVGVLRASEPIEKRYLFLSKGPAPVYAYSATVKGDTFYIANNHEQGLEQIYLRPYQRGEDVMLRITLVAYERIVDILEAEVKLPDELARRIMAASAAYRRPLWRSFSDSNLL